MKVKRMLKRMAAIVCVLAVLFVIPVSAASTAPYYKNTFQLLEHGNVRASMMLSRYRLFTSGWFNTGEYTFHDSEPFRMVRYAASAFTSEDIAGGNDDGEYYVYSYLGVGKQGLGGLKVEAGGVLDIKFDWYYNVRLGVSTNFVTDSGYLFIEDLPVTGLDSRTKMYFSDDQTSGWYNIDAVEVENHGLYSGSSSSDPTALYWSTVHFQFYNDTDRTLEFEAFLPYYDVLSGFRQPQFKEIINEYGYPKGVNLLSIQPSPDRNYLYMGYKADALPSYKIVAPEQASDFIQTQAIQKASEDISDSIDELGDKLGEDLDDLASSIDSSIQNALGDESEFQSDPDRYTDKTEEGNKHNSDLKDQEDQKEAILNDAVNGASDALKEYNFVDVGVMMDGMESLTPTFAVISDGFGKILGSLGVEFGSFFMYLIAGGVLLALLGEIAGAFSSGIRSKRRSAAAEKKRKGD